MFQYLVFLGAAVYLGGAFDYIKNTVRGQTIKIVKFDNRWFLDGDLPCGFLCF